MSNLTKRKKSDELLNEIAELKKRLSQKHCPHCLRRFEIKKAGNPLSSRDAKDALKGEGHKAILTRDGNFKAAGECSSKLRKLKRDW